MMRLSDILKDIVEPDSFSAQYQDPRWRRVSEAYRQTHLYCHSCKRSDVRTHAHHVNYERGKKLWEIQNGALVTLCEGCHSLITEVIRKFRCIASFCNASNIAKIAILLELAIKAKGETRVMLELSRLADET